MVTKKQVATIVQVKTTTPRTTKMGMNVYDMSEFGSE
jgi:hypothetical protein